VLAVTPRNLLDDEGFAAAAVDAPHWVQQKNQKAPERHKPDWLAKSPTNFPDEAKKIYPLSDLRIPTAAQRFYSTLGRTETLGHCLLMAL
jgi:hypothetical protein